MSASKLTKLMIIGLTSLPLICAQADEATTESADERLEIEASILPGEIVGDGGEEKASDAEVAVDEEVVYTREGDDGAVYIYTMVGAADDGADDGEDDSGSIEGDLSDKSGVTDDGSGEVVPDDGYNYRGGAENDGTEVTSSGADEGSGDEVVCPETTETETTESKTDCEHMTDNPEGETGPFNKDNDAGEFPIYTLNLAGAVDANGIDEQAESESGRAQLSDSNADARGQEAQPMSSITEESSAPARFTSPVAEKFTIEFQY